MFERAEASWRRQLEGEEAASVSGSRVWRTLLLAVAIIALLFLLFQQLAFGG